MWLTDLPVAIVPLWQEAQVPVTWVWSSGKIAGFHVLVVWQDWQLTVEVMCVGVLPVAIVPLWQLTHPEVMPAWLKVAGFQALVT